MSTELRKFICVTEDAYKIIVSPETKSLFSEKNMIQIFISDEELAKKVKSYKVNNEDKKIRIIKPILDENNIVRDISMVTKIEKGEVTWDRG